MELTYDKRILNTIRCYTIEFDSMPQQTEHDRPNPVRMSRGEQLALDTEIQSFIEDTIVKPCIRNKDDIFLTYSPEVRWIITCHFELKACYTLLGKKAFQNGDH